jgi:uncharacterized protein (UPF0335 family)
MPQRNTPEQSHFDRIIRLEREKQNLSEDIKSVYAEAKEDPDFHEDIKVLRRAVRLALESDEKRQKRRQLDISAEELLRRLGALCDMPLGRAAVAEAMREAAE